jgi:RimJ/RimL family protein N-acetyltransferase
MTSSYFYSAMARERHAAFLAEADAARQAKQARRARRRPRPADESPRPVAEGSPVVLRDGSTVLIRPVGSSDAPLLTDGFARLSARSRRLRFLGPKTALSDAELRFLTNVDHHDHEALGALNPADGRGVGIARYVRDASDPRAAEIGLTIVDDWHGRGLGRELLARLSERARQEGVCRFTATVSYDNVPMARLLLSLDAVLTGRDHGIMEYEIPLQPAESGLSQWFQAADDGKALAWP